MLLEIGNLPNNRLALTNKVYVNHETYQNLANNTDLVSVNGSIYTIASHPEISDPSQICLNGLQRRTQKLAIGNTVSVDPFFGQESDFAVAISVGVDLLSKKQVQGRAREVDTDKLYADFLTAYESQYLAVGHVLAISFEGTTLELVVSEVEVAASLTNGSKTRNKMGQFMGATDLNFHLKDGSKGLSLSGSKLQGGGGGGSSIFLNDFDFEKLGIGGLNAEFNQIFRRAFASRIWPSHIIKQMGISHVRGMLLYGPPGCGKTLIARQIGKVLNAREPKIVNGPEILNKYVGGSEEKIRELFVEAEQEQNEMGDSSMLHIIILDEMDAICKQRGTVRDGTGVSDSVVNQLLSKIDGVDSLNNILLIGMTNRKDMIDDALLRPGRLEVHVEIGLPDADGRLQVLNIHTKSMREANRMAPDALVGLNQIAAKAKNFSGAELEGIVKSASSFAFTRCVDVNDLSKAPDEKSLIIQYADFEQALNEVEPKFGAKSQELKALYRNGMVDYGAPYQALMGTMMRLVEQVRTSVKTPLMSVLLEGPSFSGKSALAAKVAVESGFPFVRMISADEMIGYSDISKCQVIHKAFLDSYKSPLSLIFIDDIERIIDYVAIGPRFSNTVLQTLLVLLKKTPPDDGRRLMVIGTSSVPHLLDDLGLLQAFSLSQHVGLLQEPLEIQTVLQEATNINASDAASISQAISKPIGIKQLLMVAEMATHGKGGEENGDDIVDTNTFLECLHTVGY